MIVVGSGNRDGRLIDEEEERRLLILVSKINGEGDVL